MSRNTNETYTLQAWMVHLQASIAKYVYLINVESSGLNSH